jgi:hypothetical protein
LDWKFCTNGSGTIWLVNSNTFYTFWQILFGFRLCYKSCCLLSDYLFLSKSQITSCFQSVILFHSVRSSVQKTSCHE